MRINQNIMAFNSYRNLSATNTQLGKSLEKLSSGFRINRAADDAAGLVVSEGLRAQVSGLQVATRNAQDGTSVVQTAEGALTEVHSMLRRMRDLTLQASNTGANDQAARDAAQAEIAQLTEEIDRVANDTKFGQVALLDGSYGVTQAKIEGSSTAAQNTFAILAAADTFTINVGGGARAVDLVEGAANTFTADSLESTINNALFAALNPFGEAGRVSAEVIQNTDGTFKVTLNGAEGATITIADTEAGTLSNLGLVSGTVEAPDGTGGRFQVGANANETIEVAIDSMRTTALGVFGANTTGLASANFVVNGTDQQRIDALGSLDEAIEQVSSLRGDLGAIQNRFEHTIANLSVTAENLAASESRIRDTDMALELVSFTRHQILQQAGTAMLAQANAVPQSVLSLLR